MTISAIDHFLTLIRNQFGEEDSVGIHLETDIKLLKSWSSLQTMIIVNEIDKEYNVILSSDDFKRAGSVAELYQIVQSKLN